MYYNGVCKNCRQDCDDTFCSEDCREEWESGYYDYLEGLAEDRKLTEEGWL